MQDSEQLKKLKRIFLEYLMKAHKKYACICIADMCSSCDSFKQTNLENFKKKLLEKKIPYSIRECRNNKINRDLLLSTGTSGVPCVIWIENESFKVMDIDSFDNMLKTI
jgi:hypothetical protein